MHKLVAEWGKIIYSRARRPYPDLYLAKRSIKWICFVVACVLVVVFIQFPLERMYAKRWCVRKAKRKEEKKEKAASDELSLCFFAKHRTHNDTRDILAGLSVHMYDWIHLCVA